MTAITILLIIFIWTILSGLAFYYKTDSVGMTDYANDFFEACQLFFNKDTVPELKRSCKQVFDVFVIVLLWLSVPVVMVLAYLYAPIRFVVSHFTTKRKRRGNEYSFFE